MFVVLKQIFLVSNLPHLFVGEARAGQHTHTQKGRYICASCQTDSTYGNVLHLANIFYSLLAYITKCMHAADVSFLRLILRVHSLVVGFSLRWLVKDLTSFFFLVNLILCWKTDNCGWYCCEKKDVVIALRTYCIHKLKTYSILHFSAVAVKCSSPTAVNYTISAED